ncbi:MAG: XRE family transcriptional regulator [Alphaproteobacteria bacterium]|nr:XRE family transcriptional regulator [Alphaproteobacteria bacterium]
MSKDKIERGSGNVFADIGMDDSDEMLAKAHLTHQIYKIVTKRGLKQREAADVLGLKQPDVSALMNGKFLDFSVDRLLQLLVRLNQEVEIVIKPARKNAEGGIHVHAM